MSREMVLCEGDDNGRRGRWTIVRDGRGTITLCKREGRRKHRLKSERGVL